MSIPPFDLLGEALARRSVALNTRGCREDGEFVLYWMRTAVRDHENPALDATIEIADSLGLPVLVYHALSERYPYASDRHHTFILEGARDVQRGFARRGIPYAFHLERPGHRGDHLLTLAERAAAVVTESFPWTPIRRWTKRLARQAPVGVLGVDAACLVPMKQVPASARDRAFRFRKATTALREEALAAQPFERDPQVPGTLPELPFEPLDLSDADIPGLVACCEIDHGVGPVDHTPGGSVAGYARWHAFLDQGLARYHRRRNDATDDGVSRMSAYLHYGHVSAFRLARDADALGGDGAEKFLDELLVWREMSWAWAYHAREHDALSVLPDWARETLAAHAADPRPVLHDVETLSRGRTGDALWDAAQRSLLIHGELHNNVRMTWGKMLPLWSRDPETALARLVDLNHRYALDGRDPNSYGGLLWCLGGFDRPFDPPRPVLGRVRPRDTATHARRLDVVRYAEQTGRPTRDAPPRTLVVGAGMAGLVCARTLADHGWPVTIVDKGRAPGGRLATRRPRHAGETRFDHGAVAFGATDVRFRRFVDAWVERGLLVPDAEHADRFVCSPDARALGEHLATDLDSAGTLHCERRITALSRREGKWWASADDEVLGPFETLVLATPPAQAAALVRSTGEEPHADIAARLEAVAMRPRWTLLARCAGAGDDRWREHPDDGTIGTLLHGPAHAGAPAPGAVVIHATEEWSGAALEQPPEAVATQLAARAAEHGLALTDVRAHRWRYARAPRAPAGTPAWYPDEALALCGDWTGERAAVEADDGPGVQAAFLAGSAAAGRLLGAGFTDPEARRATPVTSQDDLFDVGDA